MIRQWLTSHSEMPMLVSPAGRTETTMPKRKSVHYLISLLMVALLGACSSIPRQVSSTLMFASKTLSPEECLKRTEDFIKVKYSTETNEDVILDRTKEGPFEGLRLRTSPKHNHGFQILILFASNSDPSTGGESVALMYYFSYKREPPGWIDEDWDLERDVASIQKFITTLP